MVDWGLQDPTWGQTDPAVGVADLLEPEAPTFFDKLAEPVKAFARGIEHLIGTAGSLAKWAVESPFVKTADPGAALTDIATRWGPDWMQTFAQKMQRDEKETIKMADRWADWWQEQTQKGWEAPSQAISQAKWTEMPVTKFFSTVAEAAPNYLAAIAASLITKSPKTGLMFISAVSGGEAYRRQRKKGTGIQMANAVAMLTGAWEYATEKIPFEAVLKPSKHLLRKMLKVGSLEAAQEFIQGIGENFLEYFGYNAKDLESVPMAVREGTAHMMDNWVENIAGGFGLGMLGVGVVGRRAGAPAEIPPEAPRAEAITPVAEEKETKPATREQKAQAHILARERGISEEDYKELAGKSMAEMTSVEAERFIGALRAPAERLDLTDTERKTIRGTASEETLVRTIDYATRLGEVPKEKQARKAYVQNLQLVARSQQKRALKLDLKEGKANLINQFSSARYAMGEAEIKSGLPLRQEHTNIVYEANEAKLQALNIVTTALKEAGTTPFRVAMKRQQNDSIAEWLFEEDIDKRKTKWEKLDEPTKAVATQLHEIFQGPAALEIREASWRIWNEGGRQPSNAPDSALEEGRQAQKEGRLKEWIASQTWGTREFYYMSSAQIGDLAESLSKMSMSLSIEEKPVKVGAKPKVYLPEIKARKYAKRAKGGSVINATLDHLERVMVANATHDSLKTFWSDFAKAEPTREDVSVMKEFINSALGKHKRAVKPIRAVRKVSRAFWRFYFISPLKSGWFATRNLLQNIAWGPSELPVSQWILSAKRILAEKITGKVNEERAADFARDFKIKISQKRQMYRQFLLQEEGNITKAAGNRALVLMDMAGQAAVLSDEANRIMAWPIMYDAAQRNLNLYLNGKISYNKVARKLRLDTFHLSQQLELQQLANKKGKRDFVAKYAEYKTENVHFRYETAFRSGIEQTPAGRVIAGLYVYPKGVSELIYQNSVKPMVQGWQTGNYNKAYQGFVGLVMLFAGAAAAERLIREIAGKYAYDVLATVFSYNPFGPGAGLLFDFFNRIGRVVYWAEREKKSPAEIADAAAAAAVDQLEFFIPMCDGYINYYENKNNKAGVRLYRLMKKEALSKYFRIKRIKFRRSNRDMHEKIQHQLFGGAEWPEKE